MITRSQSTEVIARVRPMRALSLHIKRTGTKQHQTSKTAHLFISHYKTPGARPVYTSRTHVNGEARSLL
jgi:hypothetical protein